MKLSTLLSISASLLFVGCSSSGLSTKIQTLNVSASSTKPTTLLTPPKETEFAAAAERETAFVEQAVRTSTLESIGQFQRFQRGSDSGADATVIFDAIRHGVTRVGDGLYAPTIEADVRVVGLDNKQLLRLTRSATSGELHPLDTFVKNTELYREALRIAAQKLAVELTSAL